MKFTALLLTLLLSVAGYSQQTGEVVFFDNSGYKFHVILNGIKQNATAESNIRVEGLRPSFYSCTVMADDNTFSVDKNIIVKSDTLITYRITNKRGKFKLRFYSEVPLQSVVNEASQSVVTYHTEETVPTNTGVVVPTTPSNSTVTTVVTSEETSAATQPGTSMDVNVTIDESQTTESETITTTTTTETRDGMSSNTSVGADGGSISISMDVNENGANVNIQGSGLEGEGMQSESTVTTTTTTTTSAGDWSNDMDQTTDVDMEVTNTDVVDCFVGEDDFERFHKQIKNETFDDDKTALAKQYVQRKCLSVDQVGILMDVLSFSEDRMTVAKAAYDMCYDNSEYYRLTEKFDFSDDKEALLDFINKK